MRVVHRGNVFHEFVSLLEVAELREFLDLQDASESQAEGFYLPEVADNSVEAAPDFPVVVSLQVALEYGDVFEPGFSRVRNILDQ